MSELVVWDAASRAIEQARTIDEVKDIRDKAEALRLYSKQAGESLEVQNAVAEIKIRAERKAGELLAEMEKAQGSDYGGRTSLDGSRAKPSNPPPTLADIGINKSQSSRWQQIAAIDEPVFEEYVAETKAAGKELTSAGALRLARRVERQETPPLPSDKYRVVYADPPWKYGNSGVINDDNYGHVARHYPSMSIEELCALPVIDIVEDNAVLFMWVTSPLLEECFPVIRAWGFRYKTSFVWDKMAHNFGHYNSVRHELLLICVRGSCTPDTPTLYDSVQSIKKSRTHSEKPEQFRAIIDDLYPHGRRIELFARTATPGWESWGNEPNL